MKRIADRKEAQAIDRAAIGGYKIPSLCLMEQAARALAERAREMAPSGKILAVCGTGNNGADGLAALRILHGRGRETQAVIVGDPARATEEWKIQKEALGALGIPALSGPCEIPSDAALVIDALFGVGLSRAPEGIYKEMIEAVNRAACPVLAADIASGLPASGGPLPGACVKADATVTFGLLKLGQVLDPGRSFSGEVEAADIGFPPEAVEEASPGAFCLEKEDLSRLPARPEDGHKGTFGRVLICAGSRGMAGAAVLAARGSMRAGAGLTRVLTEEGNRTVLQTAVPEALLSAWGEGKAPEDAAAAAAAWADAVVIGPGLGTGQEARALLTALLRAARGPFVLDADALNILSQEPELWPLLAGRAVLTPHVGEAARLAGVSNAEVLADPVGTARGIARRAGAVCLLKSGRSVIAGPEGPVCVNMSGNQGMGTGGSGDVLAGITGTLLAGGAEIFDAACLAAYVHGLAGDAAARKKSARGMTAGDIAAALADVFLEAENR